MALLEEHEISQEKGVHNAAFAVRKWLAIETIIFVRHILVEQKYDVLDIVYFEVGIKRNASDFRSLQYGITWYL